MVSASHNLWLYDQMDLAAVRTFVAVADAGQFLQAAAELAITQQAVSKRVAALEQDLGVRLFVRTARGARLTIDGQAFLPHARELLRVEERAASSVRQGRRALRVDIVGRQLAPAGLLRKFHQAQPNVELDVVRLFDADAAIAAVRSGTIDASFRALVSRPDGVESARVLDEPLHLVVGPSHEFAAAREIRPDQLVGQRIWMPSIVEGTEWAAFYTELAAAFGLVIDTIGPNFGIEPLLDAIADSPALATFVGEQTRIVWPAGHDLRRIALREPVPVYPHSLIWQVANHHPALTLLRAHLATPAVAGAEVWQPVWARGQPPPGEPMQATTAG
jgi:DNA-binding transcriptional LysR family regulator